MVALLFKRQKRAKDKPVFKPGDWAKDEQTGRIYTVCKLPHPQMPMHGWSQYVRCFEPANPHEPARDVLIDILTPLDRWWVK